MKLTVDEFRAWDHKSVTLMGMSGVGKTRLSNLLRSDSIYIRNNITVDHLKPVSTFMGMLGNPELGGMSLKEFKRRQHLHREAEIAVMYDVPDFIRKARTIYGYQHFINDVGGSLCELDEPGVIQLIAEHTFVLYIQATERDEERLIKRAMTDPKPLYYREAFLDEQLEYYMRDQGITYTSLIDPRDFTRWVFPRLFRSRIPRYEAIAAAHGYTVTTDELSQVETEQDFLELLERVIARES